MALGRATASEIWAQFNLPDGHVSRLKGNEAELAGAPLIGQGVLVPHEVARHGRIRVPGERAAQRRAKPIAEPGRAIRGVDDEIDVGARLDVPVGVLALINSRLPVREHLGPTHNEAKRHGQNSVRAGWQPALPPTENRPYNL